MSAAHTPGPWVWDDRSLRPVVRDPDTCNVHSILDAEGGYGFIGGDNKACMAELEADYRLIAAAPDLLMALKLAFQHLNGGGDSLNALEHAAAFRAARAAIAKAEGAA